MTHTPQVDLLYLEAVEDAVLCGAKFVDPKGSRFVLTAYDSKAIHTFMKQSTPV